MGLMTRLSLRLLPVMDCGQIDAAILYKDICVRVGWGGEQRHRMKNREPILTLTSLEAADVYINPPPTGATRSREVAWKRIGRCLVYLDVEVDMLPPVAMKCIVRAGEGIWKVYSFDYL
jgi:hypothetical protein